MQNELFSGRTLVKARAVFAGERVELRALEAGRVLPTLPAIIRAGEHGYAALFRYGVVVMFNLLPLEEISFLNHLRPFVREPYERPATEEVDLHIDPTQDEKVDASGITLRDTSAERLQVVADILGKSVVLAHYEASIAEAFDRIEPLAASLRRNGRGGYSDVGLLKHIGSTLAIQHTMVARVEVAEKPEILWDRGDLERLYVRLEDEYELRERHLALERKLELVSRTAETLLDLLQHKRSLRVEWYIVLLIVFEIILTLYELATLH